MNRCANLGRINLKGLGHKKLDMQSVPGGQRHSVVSGLSRVLHNRIGAGNILSGQVGSCVVEYMDGHVSGVCAAIEDGKINVGVTSRIGNANGRAYPFEW